MFIQKSLAAVTVAFAALAAPAGAAVLTFNDLAGTNMAGSYDRWDTGTAFTQNVASSVQGFTFTSSSQWHYYIGSDYGNNTDAGSFAYNGTDFLMNYNGITMRSASATPFTVNSLDLKAWENSGISTVTLFGTRAAGGSTSMTVNLNTVNNQILLSGNDFTKYALSNFTGLSSLSITANTGGYLAIDNITVNASTVPEPGTLAVFGLGLAGLALVRRRKQK